ncbi:MAG: hypothetical protein ACXWTS_06565 [Methylococcaceae bacterium]
MKTCYFLEYWVILLHLFTVAVMFNVCGKNSIILSDNQIGPANKLVSRNFINEIHPVPFMVSTTGLLDWGQLALFRVMPTKNGAYNK